MSRETTRAERRQLARDNAKMPTALVQVPKASWPPMQPPPGLLQVWRSREFLVQIFDAPSPAVYRITVNRAQMDGPEWKADISWDELQRLKRECGLGDVDAVEVYPRDVDVVHVANMRHLFVLAAPLPFAWRMRPIQG